MPADFKKITFILFLIIGANKLSLGLKLETYISFFFFKGKDGIRVFGIVLGFRLGLFGSGGGGGPSRGVSSMDLGIDVSIPRARQALIWCTVPSPEHSHQTCEVRQRNRSHATQRPESHS